MLQNSEYDSFSSSRLKHFMVNDFQDFGTFWKFGQFSNHLFTDNAFSVWEKYTITSRRLRDLRLEKSWKSKNLQKLKSLETFVVKIQKKVTNLNLISTPKRLFRIQFIFVFLIRKYFASDKLWKFGQFSYHLFNHNSFGNPLHS